MITSEQVRAARALLRWEQKDLAEASGVSLPSIKRLETQAGALAAQPRTAEAIQAAFQSAGVQFIAENGGGAGVRLAKPKNEASIESQIDTLHAEADALDTSGPASPRKALNTMKQAIARNDARKLTARGKKKT